MLYVKYVYPTGQEQITGPYEMVTAEYVDDNGKHIDPGANPVRAFRTVYAYTPEALARHSDQPDRGASMTYGPNIPAARAADAPETHEPTRHGTVYVMNDSGATLSKYIL